MTDFTKSPYWSPMRDEHSNRFETILLWKETAEPVLAALQTAGATRLLDAGCGTGQLLQALVAKGWDATGLTYQASEVAAFNQRCPDLAGRAQQADLHAIPFPDETFDAVVCWDVLEHTMAPLHVLGELRRVTKPGGTLILFVPGEEWIECAYHIIVPNIRQPVHLLFLAQWHIDQVYDGSSIQPQCAVYFSTKADVGNGLEVQFKAIRRNVEPTG